MVTKMWMRDFRYSSKSFSNLCAVMYKSASFYGDINVNQIYTALEGI